jgi:hypothetical protein
MTREAAPTRATSVSNGFTAWEIQAQKNLNSGGAIPFFRKLATT